MTLALDIPDSGVPEDRTDWAARINRVWRETFESVLAVGRILIEARAALPVGEFGAMVESDLPFSRQTAYKLIAIAGDKRLTVDAYMRQLPPSWGTLYELTQLPDKELDAAFAEGRIRPDMEIKDAKRLRTAQRHGERLATSEAKAAASPPPLEGVAAARRYPVVYLDPPWRFETWSEKGMEKAAENHYPTMSFDELAALPVSALAADDAALWCWADREQLAAALALIQHWGFVYKSCCSWTKLNAAGNAHMGKGYWFRDCSELLLVATRGDMPAPLPEARELSTIVEPVGRHSEKPARFREIIDRYFPGVSKIELFARGILPAGWDGWGNEYRRAEAAE